MKNDSDNKFTGKKPASERPQAKRPQASKLPQAKQPPARKTVLETSEKAHEGERIAKVMARVGLCSRRDAEDWIASGRVSVNGEVLASAARNVTEEDKVVVDGKPLATRERTRLFLFHKPRGLVTTDRDPEGRATVFDFIAEKNPGLPRLMSVGRLDINTEGLLLLTNDGGLARVLELPSTGWLRRYRARANGQTDQNKLDTLKKGVTLDGIDYAGVDARLDRVQGANVWITLSLREGKNREVKKLLEHLLLGVNRLIRTSYGPFQLGEMAEGAVEEIRTRVLAEQLGDTLAAEAGVDFDGPVIDRTPEPEPERPPRAPRSERPAEKVRPRTAAPSTEKSGPRKHVSALRQDRVKAELGPRRRVEKTATADRNGRAVTVERVSVARTPELQPDNRNARRFRAERDQDEGRRPFDAPRLPRGEERGPKKTFAPRGETGAAKSFRREPDSGSRSEERGPKKAFAPRGETGAAKPFRRDPDSGPRSEERGPKKAFAPRGETGAAKPFRRDPEGIRFSGKPGSNPMGRPGGKPPGKGGGRPTGGKPTGGKSTRGTSPGRPFGKG